MPNPRRATICSVVLLCTLPLLCGGGAMAIPPPSVLVGRLRGGEAGRGGGGGQIKKDFKPAPDFVPGGTLRPPKGGARAAKQKQASPLPLHLSLAAAPTISKQRKRGLMTERGAPPVVPRPPRKRAVRGRKRRVIEAVQPLPPKRTNRQRKRKALEAASRKQAEEDAGLLDKMGAAMEGLDPEKLLGGLWGRVSKDDEGHIEAVRAFARNVEKQGIGEDMERLMTGEEQGEEGVDVSDSGGDSESTSQSAYSEGGVRSKFDLSFGSSSAETSHESNTDDDGGRWDAGTRFAEEWSDEDDDGGASDAQARAEETEAHRRWRDGLPLTVP